MVSDKGTRAKGAKKQACQISPWFYHFKPLARSVCQEFAAPMLERALLNKKARLSVPLAIVERVQSALSNVQAYGEPVRVLATVRVPSLRGKRAAAKS
jgi:hypothetical protein